MARCDYGSEIKILADGRSPLKWRVLMRYLLSNYHHYAITELEAAKMVDAYFPLEHNYLNERTQTARTKKCTRFTRITKC